MTQEPEKYRILIVDDKSENIEMLGELLSDYRRNFALDGARALELARGESRPDLILLDIMMPRMDGFEVCRQLKADADTAEIPIIFVTSLGEETDEAQGLKLGAVDYITKPFRPAVVKARVKTHLELQAARRSLARQNQILEEKVAGRTGQLSEAFARIKRSSLETIYRLSRAAEYKDDDTGAHVLRMSQYAAAVARKMGKSVEFTESLLRASPMHDVGKIGIPDRVLLKPGKLDPAEWDIMREHSKMGAVILQGSDSPIIQLGEVIALSHHEKWDGAGYPNKLSGSQIPPEGRIVAIADVFDALTSRRPYKEPFSLDKSFSILKEGRGTHFDPEVIDAFFDAQDEILKIKERFSDGDMSHLYTLASHDQATAG